MAVVFDASVLIDLFNKKTIGDRQAKLSFLVETLTQQRSKVLIPTPALTEFLVKAGKEREAYLRGLSSSAFSIEPFDQRAALECALLLDEAWLRQEKSKVTHTKFKFDWQILAIAASRNAKAIYSDDEDLARAATRISIRVHSTDSLPLPPSALQQPLPWDASESSS